MKWENNIRIAVSFLVGVLVCYMSLQFSYFDIKKELDVPNIVISTITLLVGLFIAITIQKRVTKNQNSHSYLISKIDKQWNSFNEISENLSVNDKIDISTLQLLIKNVIHPTSYLSRLFTSFDIDCNCITDLDQNLEELEDKLSNMPASQNIIDISSERINIEDKLLKINHCFVKVLKQVQNM